jgi:hypothetical protein
MLRPLALGIAVSILAAACALVEPPPPAGTVMVQLQVKNGSFRPADLAVATMAGRPLPGLVRPPTVPPGATTDVSFFVPLSSDWMIRVNGQDLIMRSDLRGRTGAINNIGIEVDQSGNSGWWCNANC